MPPLSIGVNLIDVLARLVLRQDHELRYCRGNADCLQILQGQPGFCQYPLDVGLVQLGYVGLAFLGGIQDLHHLQAVQAPQVQGRENLESVDESLLLHLGREICELKKARLELWQIL